MSVQNSHLEALQDIRQMMQRSSRFISLSGLSGIAAGICGLAGSYGAHLLIQNHVKPYRDVYASRGTLNDLDISLFLLALATFTLAVLSAFYFTWRKTKKDRVALWNHTSLQLAWNMILPLVAGGLFILALLQNGIWMFIVPGCLVFYGLALVNASKYTLSDIRYLGISEIILGLIATQFTNRGLVFWAIGFGVLHIVYGFLMWNKYERKADVA
ncbi:MAG TPA: hypothetical protein VMR70_13305 [Flavisolibacter sp.]|nr:hypothetical protein [Flavisolibacter sp.]